MRILQISSAKTFGGGERHFVDLCRGLQSRGHAVFVALRPTNEWREKLSFLPPENFLYVSLRNSFGVLSATRIAEFVRENNIEIVHAHAARDYLPAGIACRITKNTKFFLTRHVLFPLKPFHRFALTNLTKAIAVSKAVEANLQRTFPKSKIALISNGINPQERNASREESRQAFRFENDVPFDDFLVGTIGELVALKGHRDFVLAANIVAQKFPNARFVIVGKDNSFKKDFRRELKRMVKIFRLEERFLWLDWVEELAPLLAALDVFVSASHTESFGLAILEAMNSECAVVATATEGAKELLDAHTGKIVAINEPVEIAAAVAEFLEDENLRASFGANAHKKAVENFNLDKMIDETEKLYLEASSQNRPRD